MTLEELNVIINAQTAQFRKELNQVQNQVNSLTSNVNKKVSSIKNIFSRLGKFMAVLGIGKILKDSITSAMDSIESESLVGTVFGNMTKDIQDWSNNLQETLGLNAYSVRKNAATLFNMSKSLGMTGDNALEVSKDLTLLAEDMASFYNISSDEAFTKIRSGITGETEPLKQLGIMIDENTLKQYGYSQSMTNSEKVMVRYKAIMAQTSAAHGDLARTIDSPANQLRILKNNLQMLSIELGRAFMPILTTVLPILNSFIQGLTRTMSVVASFMSTLFGKSGSASSGVGSLGTAMYSAADGAGALSSNLNAAGSNAKKAAKEVKSLLSGFDEINSLSSGNGTDTSGAAGLAGEGGSVLGAGNGLDLGLDQEPDTSGVNKAAKKIKSTIKGIVDTVKENKKTITSMIAGILASIAGFAVISNWTAIVKGLSGALSAVGKVIGAINTPVLLIAAAIGLVVGNIVYLWQTNEEFRNSVIDVWTEIQTFIGKVVDDIGSILQGIWAAYGEPLLTNLKNFMKSIQDTIIAVWEGFIKPVIEGALEMLTWLWDKHLKGLVQQVGEFVMKLVNGALEVYNGFIAPIVNWLIRTLGPVFSDSFKFILDVCGSLFAGISDVFKGIFKVLGGLIDFIAGVFTGNWKKAWQGLKDIVRGIFDALVGVVKVPINRIIDVINNMIRGLNKINIKIPSWVPGFGGKNFGINIPSIPKLAKGGIVDSTTLAMIGERGKEAVMPLENNTEWIDKLADKLAKNIVINNSNTGDRDLYLELHIGDTKFGKVCAKAINKAQAQEGRILLEL